MKFIKNNKEFFFTIILSFFVWLLLIVYFTLNFKIYEINYNKNYFFDYKSDFRSNFTLMEYGKNLEWNYSGIKQKEMNDRQIFGKQFFVNNEDIRNLDALLDYITNLDKKILSKRVHKKITQLIFGEKHYLIINKKYLNNMNLKIFKIFNFYKSLTTQTFSASNTEGYVKRKFRSFCKNLKIKNDGFHFYNCWITRHEKGLKLNDKFILSESKRANQILTPRDRLYIYKTVFNTTDKEIILKKNKILDVNKFYHAEIYFKYDDLIQYKETVFFDLFYSFLSKNYFFLINLIFLPFVLIFLIFKIVQSN